MSVIFKYEPAGVEQVESEQDTFGGFYLNILFDGKPMEWRAHSDTCEGIHAFFGSQYVSEFRSDTLCVHKCGFTMAKNKTESKNLLAMKEKLPKIFTAFANTLEPMPAECTDLITGLPFITTPTGQGLKVLYKFIEPGKRKVIKEVKHGARFYFYLSAPIPKGNDKIVLGVSADQLVTVSCHANLTCANSVANYGWNSASDSATEQQLREACRDLANKLLAIAHPAGSEHWPIVEKTTQELL